VEIEKVIAGFFILSWVGAALFLFVPLLLWWEATTFSITKIDPEVVNGILTVSGIVFGFQFAFFKAPKGKVRVLWVIGLVSQVFSLAFVGLRYVSDTMSYGYLTTNTLLLANFDFALILLFTTVFASLDWMLHWR